MTLDGAALTATLAPDGFTVRVVASTGSTNADLAAAAREGAPDRTVLVAGRQTAGRGRLGRTWESPAGHGLTFSLLVRPDVPPAQLGWMPLLAGVAVAEAVRDHAALPALLKWPNDVQVGDAKLAGILAEAVTTPVGPTAVVLGIGLNVTTPLTALPQGGTSLTAAGYLAADRCDVLVAVLRRFAHVWAGWSRDPSSLAGAYRGLCGTLGRTVRVDLAGGTSVTGVASSIDDAGRLIVDGRPYGAGDVTHLRPVFPSTPE